MRARNFRGRAALLSALGALVAVTLAASLWAGAGATASASAAAPVVVPPTQELALLLGPHEAMSGPDARSTPIQLVNAERPLTGEQTALPVIGHATAAHGAKWLRVMLPGRPNGRTAWIEQAGTVRAVTPWHIVVDTTARRVTVYQDGRAVRAFEAIVGKPSTPTPDGEFFVEEAVQLPPSAVGAPYAARAERPLHGVPGVRRRSGPDRSSRAGEHRRSAGHCSFPRLRAARRERHDLAGGAHRAGCAGDDHQLRGLDRPPG